MLLSCLNTDVPLLHHTRLDSGYCDQWVFLHPATSVGCVYNPPHQFSIIVLPGAVARHDCEEPCSDVEGAGWNKTQGRDCSGVKTSQGARSEEMKERI